MNQLKENNNLKIEILVVEDSPTQALKLKHFLEQKNYLVSTAQNGMEALDLLQKSRPAMVISDIIMPEMDGFELCHRIKNDKNLKDIPVLVLSNLSEPHDIIKALESGADNFLTKPFDEDLLNSRIQQVLLSQERRLSAISGMGIEIFFGGHKYFITSDRLQILDLLLSTYECTVQKSRELEHLNKELQQTQIELEALNQKLEQKVEERTKNITHLNKVILAVRNVNQLITREKDQDHLIQKVCEILIDDCGYNNAWIILLDESGGFIDAAEAGIGKQFQSLLKQLKQNKLPVCCQKTLGQTGLVIIENPVSICSNCPLENLYKEEKTIMCIRLEHNGTVFGLLNCLIPAQFSVSDQEKGMLEEVAEDIAFAIHNIELEKERKALEDQLRQSQKMESIGRLAGGIAHDFNNMLSPILGYSQMILKKIDPKDPNCQKLKQILLAAERSKNLTQQLLAFSRKQVLEISVLNLNELISNLEKMLCRLIGDNIELITFLEPDLGNIKVDRTQVEQIIMNLVVNAQDSMPEGGKLNIETSNVFLDKRYAKTHADAHEGSYVMLAVSDTGCGMTVEIRNRIFEPFYTTKEQGKGTGLGLSTVHGIVKQHGGNIYLYSEPGRGTSFKIYFPRVDEEIEAQEKLVPVIEKTETGDTVLIVEDDEMVRKLAWDILDEYGYKALKAENSIEAVELAEKYKDSIKLLLTDVIMPEKSGKELFEKLSASLPGLKVLYMSGYSDNIISHHGVLEAGVHFLQKPFSEQTLIIKVREALKS